MLRKELNSHRSESDSIASSTANANRALDSNSVLSPKKA